MRRLVGIIILCAVVAQADLTTRLDAHEKFKIVGSVAGLKTDEIAVKAIDGATYEIDMNDGTVVTDKNHKKIDRAWLKVGEKVVVMALGHDQFDLEAFEIQLTGR
jgi:hypothetical protein